MHYRQGPVKHFFHFFLIFFIFLCVGKQGRYIAGFNHHWFIFIFSFLMISIFYYIMAYMRKVFPHNAKHISSLLETSLAIWIMWWNILHTMHTWYYLLVCSLLSSIFSRLILSFILMTYAATDNKSIAPASAISMSGSASLLFRTISLHNAVIAIMIGNVTGIRLLV